MSIQRFLSRYINQIYALMRIAVGFLFMCHGVQKDIWIINGTRTSGDILFYLAAVIESLGGLLILLGFQASWAAFIVSGEMAVAYFKAHASKTFLPINNKGELSIFYCFVFLFISAYGSGIWSIDHFLKNKKILFR